MIKTLDGTDSGVRFIDQTKLPPEETYVTCNTYDKVADAIVTMTVRAPPAAGDAGTADGGAGALGRKLVAREGGGWLDHAEVGV